VLRALSIVMALGALGCGDELTSKGGCPCHPSDNSGPTRLTLECFREEFQVYRAYEHAITNAYCPERGMATIVWSGCGKRLVALQGGVSGKSFVYDATGALIGARITQDIAFGSCNNWGYVAGDVAPCDDAVSCSPCAGSVTPCEPLTQ
jgi:hypothetical protein